MRPLLDSDLLLRLCFSILYENQMNVLFGLELTHFSMFFGWLNVSAMIKYTVLFRYVHNAQYPDHIFVHVDDGCARNSRCYVKAHTTLAENVYWSDSVGSLAQKLTIICIFQTFIIYSNNISNKGKFHAK